MGIKYGVVLGCPRSGTTFLMKALKALGNSECISGDHLPVSIPAVINFSLPVPILNSLEFGFKHSLDNYLDTASNSRYHMLHKWLIGYADINELLLTLRKKRIVQHLIYKEPFLSFAPEFSYNALPDSRIVYIFRDGRDCADSLVRSYDVLSDQKLLNLHTPEVVMGRKYDDRYVPWWVEDGKEEEFLTYTPYVRSIWMWKEMVRRCHNFFSKPEILESGRVLFLKYEDLMSDSLKYGELVIKHFGSSMNPRLHKRLRQARTSSIGVHKRRDPHEIKLAEKVAKTELELYGYI